jgi:hypothetical protein
MVSQKFVIYAMFGLIGIIVLLLGWSTYVGHTGLFQVASDAFKIAVGAALGALASVFGSRPTASRSTTPGPKP